MPPRPLTLTVRKEYKLLFHGGDLSGVYYPKQAKTHTAVFFSEERSMSKKKSTKTEQPKPQPKKPAATFTAREIKCQGYLQDVAVNLGLDRRPSNALDALANARTLKSDWSNGGARKLPNVIARASDNVNCLRLLRGSPFEHTARELVRELRRDVPKEVSGHPGWQGFIDKMSSAIGA